MPRGSLTEPPPSPSALTSPTVQALPQAALGWLRVKFFISDMILQLRVFGGFHETEAQKELFSVDQNSLKQ